MRAATCALGIGLLGGLLAAGAARADEPAPLPGTRPLELEGDIASRMIDGIDRFLLRKTEDSVAGRARHWNRDTTSAKAYDASVAPNRERLAHILGVREARAEFPDIERGVGFQGKPVFEDESIRVMTVRWPAFGDVEGEGLFIQSLRREVLGDLVVLPDADETPEMLVGLVPGVPAESQMARRLAECGFRVVVPHLIGRRVEARNGRARLTDREYLQRSAFELGRTLPGYEVLKVLSLVDHFQRLSGEGAPVGVAGYGEGGLIALYAAALDPRIKAALVSGAFDSRLETWREPVDRNVFGLLDRFGGAELASLIAPRPLIVEASAWPSVEIPPGTGGAPGRLATPPLDAVRAEVERARSLVSGLGDEAGPRLVVSGEDGDGPPGTEPALRAFLAAFDPAAELPQPGPPPRVAGAGAEGPPGAFAAILANQGRRAARQLHQLDRHNQQLLAESPYVRAEFIKGLDPSDPEKYRESAERYRTIFRDEVIGRFDDESLPPDPRSRKAFETPEVVGYEVVLDVFPDVIAFGMLLVPKGIPDGERRPVVVCQHGLEGRPSDVADPEVNNPAYNQFALRLAERGFVTFAPQNPYIFEDRFRTLQRKANPLGKTLFSIIVPQHQQITGWLKSLPFVDGERIAFYGLSYGGKSAMRIPPLVEDYCLSICSADFNDWVWKNASTRSPYSYVWTGEYEIFEFDLGSTFNYAEMAALIAPRPFMVERGHFDGVAPDEAVASEFAKVRHLYNARLKLPPERCRIEWFVGPHTIHGVGTFDFLHEHLDWPRP